MIVEESDMFQIKKGTKQADLLPSLLFNIVLQRFRRTTSLNCKRREGMGICLGDKDDDCFANMRFADDVFTYASSVEQFQKICATSNAAQKKWVSKYIRQRRKSSGTKVLTVEKIW